MQITAKVTRSSHPDFEYFITTNTPRKIGTRTHSMADTEAWIEKLRNAAYEQGHTVVTEFDL